MDKRSDMIALCDRFFDAIEANDYDAIESCCGPEYVVWHSSDNLYHTRERNLAMLKRGTEMKSKKRFTDRRVIPFEGGFVQQHRIEVERSDGFVGRMDVCFIAYVVNGKLSRVYEYFDHGQNDRFVGPAIAKS